MRRRSALLAGVCLAASACETPLRLEVERDTVVLYGDRFSPLPVKVVDARGDSSGTVTARIRRLDSSTLALSGNQVACLRPGVVRVKLAAKDDSGSIVVACRTIRQLLPPPDMLIEMSTEARVMTAAATLESGETVSLAPIAVAIHDSTIVSVRGDRVTPLKVGYTALRIDYGGVQASTRVTVRHTLATGTLELNAGESRQWELTPGRYDISVVVKDPADLAALRMEMDGARCSRNPRNEDLIHCVVYERGSVTMSNTSAPPKERRSRATVSILKTS